MTGTASDVMAALVNLIERHRRDDDCAVWALGWYLGIPYEDIWAAVQKVDRCRGKGGLWPATLCRVAGEFGHTLKRFTVVDPDAYGILLVEDRRDAHMAGQRNRLVFDPDATAWDRDHWLKTKGYRIKGILVVSI